MKKRGTLLLMNMSLQKRISLLVLVGLTVGLSLFSWLGIQSLKANTAVTLDQRLTIARIMANNLDQTLSHILGHMQDIALTYQGEEVNQEQLVRMVNSLEQISTESGVVLAGIIIADQYGQVLQATPELSALDLAQDSEVGRFLMVQKPSVSNLIIDPQLGLKLILATVPLLKTGGEVGGVMVSAIEMGKSDIQNFSQTIRVGNTGYTEIVDGNGTVLARTEPGSPPQFFEKSDHPGRFAELITEGRATVGTCHRCHDTGQEVQRHRDVLAFAPLSTTSWGVAIRQAEEEALAPSQQLERRLFILGIIILVGTFVLVWMMMQGIVKPVKILTQAAKKVAAGDFDAALPTQRQDEIGQLGTAFFSMTRELATSHDELLTRNEELAALNSIATTVSQSLDLRDILENALRKVLEVTRTRTGCIFLRNTESGCLEMMAGSGLVYIFQCAHVVTPSACCACYQVLRHPQPTMVTDSSQCPMLADAVVQEDIDCFVSVPLKSKNRILGIMNVACPKKRPFTENDLHLLDSIGYHIALAIENSALYEEAKQKEQLRGQLLNSVITAQEEERKRIARELHDEYGQTLTGVIMSLESVENSFLPDQSEMRKKLGKVKSLVSRALQDIRRMTLDLRPSALDDLGLVTAVRAYAHEHLETKGIRVKFGRKGLHHRLAPAAETALFRILQEAIHNIVKHAAAQNVRIQLTATAGKTVALVEDDGQGFDIDAVFKSRVGTQSLGLLGIQERIALLGGTFSIKSGTGKGTRLKVEIPSGSDSSISPEWSPVGHASGVKSGNQKTGEKV